ncbi:hypothetical protein [Variovorax sp. LT1R16]|uniref:hypothetical protein n=1 Tax=Variovorax sp. LT1R16 TaxID=3443728 RepID=UPI003F4894C2
MTKNEWITRCVERLATLSTFSMTPSAYDIAVDLAGDQTDRFGASALAWQSPEDVAEEWAEEDAA